MNSESEGLQRILRDETVATWIELFGSFKDGQDLQLWCMSDVSAIGLMRALEESTKEMVQKPLLEPRILRLWIYGFQDCAQSIHGIEVVLAARTYSSTLNAQSEMHPTR